MFSKLCVWMFYSGVKTVHVRLGHKVVAANICSRINFIVSDCEGTGSQTDPTELVGMTAS